jgi:hypothetical protein
MHLEKSASTTDVLQCVDKHGVAVVHRFIDDVEPLKEEFFKLLEHRESSDLEQGNSRVKRIQGIPEYPACTKLFNSPFVQSVAEEYFSPHKCRVSQVYLTYDKDEMGFNNAWHIDPTRCLKFLFYLTDTTAVNGAMMYAPGTHKTGIYRIMYYRSRGIDNVPIWFPDDEVPDNTVSLEGEAGTLLVFEAAGMHRAGEITSGERMVMRGHVMHASNRLAAKVRNVLRKSPLNLSRYDLVDDEFINARFKSKARAN